MTITSSDAPPRSSGRIFLLLGLGLAVLGVIAYVIQIEARNLTAPWYVPIASTVGVVFLVVALWKGRTVWRILALLLVVLLAGFEWTFLLATRLPAYNGPVAVGQPFPAFTTMRADGTSFTKRDLEGDQNSVLVFFRGRW